MPTPQLEQLIRGTNLWIEQHRESTQVWYMGETQASSFVIFDHADPTMITAFILGFKACLEHVNKVPHAQLFRTVKVS